MLEDIGWTLLAYAITFFINIIPAFMPSTWMVLAFFHIQFDLPILPLTLGGALFSGLGRIVLDVEWPRATARAWPNRASCRARGRVYRTARRFRQA